LISRSDLDEAVSNRPVILVRSCMHVAVLNSKALSDLRLLERFKSSPDFLPSEGVVREEILYTIMEGMRRDLRKVVNDLKVSIDHLLANGVTTVGFVECDLQSFYALQLIKMTYGLPIRIRLYLSSKYLGAISNLGVLGGLGDDHLKLQGIKLFIDGSLGARMALLSQPYNDSEESYGVQVISRNELIKALNIAFNHELQVAIHAIGDKAIDIALSAYIETFGNVSKYRHRIEHLSIIRPDQIAMARELGVVGVVQPRFILSDWWVVNRVSLSRVNWVYPLKTLYQNLHLAISSDAPVEPVNPWESIYAAVTRGLYEGLPLYKYTHDEALTMVGALHAYTMGSSYALFSDDLAGSLEPGKYADFILVDEDPLELSIDEVRRLKVLELAIERDAALFSEPTALSLARQRRNWEIGGGISL